MYSLVLLLHVLAATVWAGGHLVLATTVLPRALRAGDPRVLLDFESGFERIGMPALLIQLASGLWLAHALLPDWGDWIALDSAPARLIGLKLLLMVVTVLTAIDARLRIIPHLDAATLPALARRVVVVTTASVLFVLVGVSFRGGLLA